jgi:hypothetical protein
MFAFADCKQIYGDVEEGLKDIAAFKSTAISYRKAGYSAKADSFDQKISNSQGQVNILLMQAKDLKCKSFKSSLNPDKYLKAADKCGKSVDSSTMEFDCDRKNWKPE